MTRGWPLWLVLLAVPIAGANEPGPPYEVNDRASGEVPEACWRAARAAVAGEDPTGGATHDVNPYEARPAWAQELVRTARIGTDERDTREFLRPR